MPVPDWIVVVLADFPFTFELIKFVLLFLNFTNVFFLNILELRISLL
jgi:hypothetical protein